MRIPENPLPATLLATCITALHFRPAQPLPLTFPPILLASTYANLSGYKIDSAGITAAWSGLYLLLAQRRKQKLVSKFGARGLIRGATLGLCVVNLVGGGLAYTFGDRKKEDREWGRD